MLLLFFRYLHSYYEENTRRQNTYYHSIMQTIMFQFCRCRVLMHINIIIALQMQLYKCISIELKNYYSLINVNRSIAAKKNQNAVALHIHHVPVYLSSAM